MQFKSIKTKFLMSLLTVGLTVSGCFAQNVLSQIEISPSDTQGYNISFGAQKPDEVKKIVSSNNKMILQMKGISVSSSYNTIYNNVADVENVLVEAASKNSVKVIFEGKDIANSQIFFETTALDAASGNGVNNEENAIELARPVGEYTPVYSEEFVEDMNSNGSFLGRLELSLMSVIKNRQVRHYVKAGVNKAAKHASKENLAYILLGLGFLALVSKVIKPSKKQESASIGLSQTLKQREIERAKDMDIAAKIQETRQKTQEPSYSAGANYAMKSYQASQKNPYTTAMNNSVTGRRPVMNSDKTVKGHAFTPAKAANMPQTNSKMTTPVAQKPQKINVDSAKFLESMAKIYEKNGRIDLARGLKENMKKVGMQKQLV